jgi:hypothetical protein
MICLATKSIFIFHRLQGQLGAILRYTKPRKMKYIQIYSEELNILVKQKMLFSKRILQEKV